MAAFFLAALTACGGDDPVDPGGGGGGGGGGTPTVTTNVAVSNNSFDPSLIQVSPGATVTWTWPASGSNIHNVTFANASITDIPNQTSGAHTTTLPTAAGDYTYECTNHGGMNGTVRVQ